MARRPLVDIGSSLDDARRGRTGATGARGPAGADGRDGRDGRDGGPAMVAHLSDPDPHPGYLTQAEADARYLGLGLSGSKAWDPPSVAAGASTTTTVAVASAAMGAFVLASFSLSLAGLVLSGYVSAAGTVTVVLHNPTAAAVDLASGTLAVRVL